MPINTVPLTDVEQLISRPVIQAIIEQVKTFTRMKNSMKVFYPGESGIMQSAGSDILSNGENKAIFEAGEYIHIEVTEKIDEDEIGINPLSRQDTPSVFYDKDVGFMLRATLQRVEVTVNFKYQSKSKSTVQRWRSNMITRMQQDAKTNLHTYNYSIVVPRPYQELIRAIHFNREDCRPYGQSLSEYLKMCSTDQSTLISNQDGSSIDLAFAHQDTRVVGQFDFSAIPDEPEYDQGLGIWSITFPYKFNYQKPAEIIANYPVLVHNYLLPDRYIIPVRSQGQHEAGESGNVQRNGYVRDMERFEMNSVMDRTSQIGGHLRIPYYDDHPFPPPVSGYGTLFTLLNSIDEDRPKQICDLREDLDDYMIDPDVFTFMEQEGQNILHPFRSIFHLNYHRWGMMSSTGLKIDKGLVLSHEDDRDPRDCHRVRLDVCVAVHRLPYEAIERLRKNPKTFVKVIASINRVLAVQPFLQVLAERRELSTKEFNYLFALHNGILNNNLKDPNGGYYYGEGMAASSSALTAPRNFPEVDIGKIKETMAVFGKQSREGLFVNGVINYKS